MTRIPGIRRVFRHELTTDRVENDVDAELAFHFEMTMSELTNGGMSPDDARREAERRFGDVARHRHALARIDHSRAARASRGDWWNGITQDMRYAARGLWHSPTFTIAAVLTLALGIGANAAMFGIVDKLLLAMPAHVTDPESIARVYFKEERPARPTMIGTVTSYPRFEAMRGGGRSFSALVASSGGESTLGSGPDARPITYRLASADLLPMLGVRPALGRFFTAAEERSGEQVVVLSHGFWRSQFGGDRGVLGRTIRVGPASFTIIGVTPKGFHGLRLVAPDLWFPLEAAAPILESPEWKNRGWYFLEINGRLRPGATRERAAAELTTAWRREAAEAPRSRRGAEVGTVLLGPILEDRGPQRSKEANVAAWLAGVSAIVLLIACANIANLLLARALRRRREIAVRLALGAGRARLVRQLMTESVLVALIGAAAALIVARWGGDAMRSLLLPNISWEGSPIDARALWFTGAVALLVGVITGLVPALQGSRPDLQSALKSGVREGTVTRWRTRRALMLAQAALSVVLLVGAGLFVRSLRNVRAVDVGFDPERVIGVQFDFAAIGMVAKARTDLYERAVERVRRLPGVEHAALGLTVPFRTTIISDLFIPGIDSVPRQNGMLPITNAAGTNFFTTLGIRIVQGRGIAAEDRLGTERVIVVNEQMARTIWPNESALGKCVKVDADSVPCSTVVGIAENARQQSLSGEPPMQYYVPLAQNQVDMAMRTLFVRAAGAPGPLMARIRAELKALGADVPYADIHLLEEYIAPQLRPWRLGATMFGIFGLLALAVAALGLYSVIAYNVAQRTHEMGVRVALGATARDIVRMVVRDGLRVALTGVAIGTVLALWAVKFAAPMLFEVSPRDPLVFGTVIVTLALVALGASAIPAIRASRVEPGKALKVE